MAEAVLELDRNTEPVKTVAELVARVQAYHPKDTNLDILSKAYEFSEAAHRGQVRRSGEAYISHPLSVAGILSELHLDLATVMTGLLHDTVEDTPATLEDIEKNFGKDVSYLVDGVTKISRITFKNTHQKQGENIRKMIVAMGKDVRVVLVKLADRLHNMRTLSHMPYEKQAAIADETLSIYAPLANRLGINAWKTELEDLSLRYLKPEVYYELAQKVAKKKKEREQYIHQVLGLLKEQVDKSKLPAKIQGRPKHLYSIYKKMHDKNLDYDQIYDVLAFRVIIQTVPQCYEVLGLVHSVYKPIPGRFKDFIAMAKANNYQSLHTAVIGPEGERIEIQIRTEEMHLVAERGIAAHWKYKEGGSQVVMQNEQKFNWLRELVQWHQQVRDSDEFLETIKSDLFESEIYVFTPRGEVKELPRGATPLDFAYSVHTELGNRVTGAKVNGRIVPLKHQLQNGDTIEVMSSPHQQPSKDWLKMCVTTRAQAKIRAYIRNEERRRATIVGQEMLERELRKYGMSINRFLKTPELDKTFRSFGAAEIDELYIQIGFGKVPPFKVVESLSPGVAPVQPTEVETALERIKKNALRKNKKSASLVRVDGMNDVLVRYARCCNPIPGDPIVGTISVGRGVTVHQASCQRLFDSDEQRRVAVEWTEGYDSSRTTKVKVVSQDAPGLMKLMGECFSTNGINVFNAQIRTNKDKTAVCLFEISVKDKSQLLKVIQDLQKIRGIIQVDRINYD